MNVVSRWNIASPLARLVARVRRAWPGAAAITLREAPDAATLRLLVLRSVVHRDPRTLRELLQAPGADPNGGGAGLLVRAVQSGHAPVIEVLLAHPRIDANRPRIDGTTALMEAVLARRADLVELLLAHPRVDPQRPRLDGKTAWALAHELGDAACIGALARHPRGAGRARMRLVQTAKG